MLRFSNDKVNEIFADPKCTFEAFQELMTDVAFNHQIFNSEGTEVSKKDANDQIKEKFAEVLGVEPGTKGKELRRAMRRHQLDIFEITEDVLSNMIITGWGTNPFFMEFVEVKNGAIGEENLFWAEDNVILTVSELSGNSHNLFRQRVGEGHSFSLKTSWYGLKIYSEFERFMNGYVDWAGLIQKVYEALDKKFNGMIYTTLGAAGSSLPAGGQWVKTGPLSDATKDTLMQLIEDVQTANGTEVVIMGTKVALSKLSSLKETSWISEQEKTERYTTGRVGFFEGVRLAEIPQVFADNDTTTRLVSNDKLMIMPVADNKFIKVFYEGDPQIKEVTDGNTNADKTMEYEYQVKMGVGIVIGRLFGIWNITGTVSG